MIFNIIVFVTVWQQDSGDSWQCKSVHYLFAYTNSRRPMEVNEEDEVRIKKKKIRFIS